MSRYDSFSNNWQLKHAAGQMTKERGLIPENTWSLWAKASSHNSDQKKWSAKEVERPQAPCVTSLCQRPGSHPACGSQKRCQSLWCGKDSQEEWGGKSNKPISLDFPSLPCSFLCWTPQSDCPSYSQHFSNLPQTQKPWPSLGCAVGAMDGHVFNEAFLKVHFLNTFTDPTPRKGLGCQNVDIYTVNILNWAFSLDDL